MVDNYKAWAYRSDGTKFLAKFKDEREAKSWGKKVGARIVPTNAYSAQRKPVQRSRSIWDSF